MAPAPLQSLSLSVFTQAGLDVRVLREDLRDPQLSGNKARKLHYNLIEAHRLGLKTLISMGGPYSNHLHALAQAGQLFGFATEAFIRGEPAADLTPTLVDCQAAGMRLHSLSREQFRALRSDPEAFLRDLAMPAYWLPEGGSNALAISGVAETCQHPELTSFAPDYVFTAAGTGATAAGLSVGLAQLQDHGEIWAVAALKGGSFLLRDGKKLLAETGHPKRRPIRVLTGFHFGGYGRRPDELLQFCARFSDQTGLPVEPLYTGRVCYALQTLAERGVFRRGSRVLLVHTGGLQGARGESILSA